MDDHKDLVQDRLEAQDRAMDGWSPTAKGMLSMVMANLKYDPSLDRYTLYGAITRDMRPGEAVLFNRLVSGGQY